MEVRVLPPAPLRFQAAPGAPRRPAASPPPPLLRMRQRPVIFAVYGRGPYDSRGDDDSQCEGPAACVSGRADRAERDRPAERESPEGRRNPRCLVVAVEGSSETGRCHPDVEAGPAAA